MTLIEQEFSKVKADRDDLNDKVGAMQREVDYWSRVTKIVADHGFEFSG